MAFTTPRTWTTGEVVTAAQLNEQIRDNENFLAQAHSVRAYKGSDQTISDATYTLVSFGAESYDTDTFHSTSTNPERITIPTGLGGLYLIQSLIVFAGSATAHIIRQRYRKNGATSLSEMIMRATAASAPDDKTIHHEIVQLVAGDYIELQVYHNVGGNLNILSGEYSIWMAATRIGS